MNYYIVVYKMKSKGLVSKVFFTDTFEKALEMARNHAVMFIDPSTIIKSVTEVIK